MFSIARKRFFSFLVFFSMQISLISSSKLNVPRVLLPFSEEGTSFILRSDQELEQNTNCFKWKSSRPELVSVTPIDEDPSLGCSSSASVAFSAKSWNKAQSVIWAEDINSPGHLLRCDVIIDAIHSLKIVTKTHELFLEEAPEEFYVRAYDDQGNEFTTVEKMIFKWNIENLVKKKSSHGDNIRFINFKDSTYSYEDSLRDIELGGKQGRKVLLEGIKTGSSKVSVRLASALYSKVPVAEVNVMVVANLYLVPGSAFIMVGAKVGYHAEQIKSNKVHQIKLPSQQYHIEIANQELAKLVGDQLQSSVAQGLKLGTSDIFLKDTNLAPDDIIRSPTADLHVVMPNYITLTVNPYKNWNVLVGNRYDIEIDIFDRDNNKIFPSDNLVAEIEVSNDFFGIERRTENGTLVSGTPLKVGIADVRATLVGVRNEEDGSLIELEPHLYASGQLEIFDKIVLNPEIAVFPWHPHPRISFAQTFDVVSASAGAPFLWTSSNQSVATISQKGVASTLGDIGETRIRAAMNRARHNFGEGRIVVIPSVGMKFLDHLLEVEIGSNLRLPLSVSGNLKGRQVLVTQCHKLPINVDIKESKVFEKVSIDEKVDVKLTKEISSEACTSVNLQGLSEGSTEIKVSYSFPDLHGKLTQLSDSVTSSSYRPLMPVQPFSGETLLAVDSSLQVTWSGGPLPWVLKPDSHFFKLEILDDSVAEAGSRIAITSSVSNVFAFEVKCLKLGSTILTLYVGNKKSKSLPNPVVVSSDVTVVCGEPNVLELVPVIPQPKDTSQPCPLTARTGRVATVAHENLSVRVIVTDDKNRRFDNISSLDINWQLSSEELGSLKVKKGVEYPKRFHPELGYRLAEDALQTIISNGKVGQLDLMANLKKSSYLGFGSIKETLQLRLVNDAIATPSSVSVFNHPNNQEFASVQFGSGYFEVVNPHEALFKTQFHATNQTVMIRPRADGEGTIDIKDLCLRANRSPVVKITTSGVARVDLVMNDKVQLGKEILAKVKLIDRYGKELSPTALKYVDITARTGKSILTLEKESDTVYLVKGDELGDTTVVASAKYGSSMISSNPAPVQVFPPLEIEPKNITLIIGSKFQVKTFGGPQPDANVEYSLGNEKIAESNLVGLIEALTLGSTRITARSVGIDRISGKKEVYSMDHAEVHVVKFHGIRIKTPLQRIRAGSQMPVFAMGTDEHQNAYSFGSAMPNLELKWSLDQEAADLVSPFYKNDLSIGDTNNGVMRFLALKPGRVVIKLQGKITSSIATPDQFQFERDRSFKHQLEVQIYEDLNLEKPNLPANTLLLCPGAEYQLKTNRDNAGHMSYTILNDNNSHKASSIKVSQQGMVKSGKEFTTATILVEDKEDFGITQRMSVVVIVKPINYMMINVEEAVTSNPNISALNVLPKGLTFPLRVSYHDNTGLEFDATDRETEFRPSRFDSLLIRQKSNTSLTTELVMEEFTVLKVDDKHNDLHDFVIFNTGRGISPNNLNSQYLAGSVIDLDNLVSSKTLAEGKWVADPKEKVIINAKSGLCTLVEPGHVRISYIISDTQRTSIDLDVRPASQIHIRRPDTMPRSQEDQFVPFVIQSEIGNETSNIFIHDEDDEERKEHLQISSLFECNAIFATRKHLNIRDYFDITAVVNFDIPSYACKFTSKDELFAPDASLISEMIELTVMPVHTTRSILKEAKVLFQFIPGFHVLTEKLEISNVESSAILAIKGLPMILDSLEVTFDNKHFQAGRGYYGEDHVKVFPIYLKESFWSDQPRSGGEDLQVSISSSIVSEVSKVPIHISFMTEGCVKGDMGWSSLFYFFLSHYQSFFVLILACIACIWITKLIIQSATNKTINQHQQPVTTNQRLASPLRGSNQSSPSLNLTNSEHKPYLWTVDNNSPLYGSPNVSSRRSPRPLTQFSYSDM